MDQVRYWRDPSFGGIDLIHATFVNHTFGTHAHDDFILCIFEHGEERFMAAGTPCVARAGAVCLIAPHVEHNGHAGSDEGWSYRGFYPSQAIVGSIATSVGMDRGSLARLGVFIAYAPDLFHRVLGTHRAFEGRLDTDDKERLFAGTLEAVLFAAVRSGPTVSVAIQDRPLVRAAKVFMEKNYADDIKVNDVSRAIGVTPSHLTRIFHAATGQHVLAYLTQVRLSHARRLLLAGGSPAEVAAATGFVDQSHLIRRFKQAFGQTPGRYLRDSGRDT